MTETTETFEERIAALNELDDLQAEAAETLTAILLHPKYTAGARARAEVLSVLDSLEVMRTCGDCCSGRCHWGGAESAAGVAAVEADPDYDRPCGCARHAVSYAYRVRRRKLAEAEAAAKTADAS